MGDEYYWLVDQACRRSKRWSAGELPGKFQPVQGCLSFHSLIYKAFYDSSCRLYPDADFYDPTQPLPGSEKGVGV